MTPFGLRRRLVRFLGGIHTEDVEDDDGEPERVVVVQAGSLPPGLAARLALAEEQTLQASATMRNGPSSQVWAVKVVDCNGLADPSTDAEVQGLLNRGWEPFSVCKFHTFTGAEGIRMYFKRPRPAVGAPGHA